MNLKNKDFLWDYLLFRANSTIEKSSDITSQGFPKFESYNPEHELYKKIQPLGLLYGHPVKSVSFNPEIDYQFFKEKEKIKLLLAEGLFSTYELNKNFNSEIKSDPLLYLEDFSECICSFYLLISPDSNPNDHTELYHKTDFFLESRVTEINLSSSHFSYQFFHNCLLFLDVYYFQKFLSEGNNSLKHYLREQEMMRFTTILIIAAASNADNKIEKEEKAIFEYILNSSGLPEHIKTEARFFFNNGLNLNEINLDHIDSWLLKKFLIEIAIFTLSSDKRFDDSEIAFLHLLNLKLGLSEQDLNHSSFAVEGFVLENWTYLQNHKKQASFSGFSEKFIFKLSYEVNNNKDKIAREIRQSKELMLLLYKGSKEKLTEEEKKIVRDQLIDILKLLPALAYFALPGSLITLPLLLKILPKNVLPSSFRD
jgi:hypothetical protein